MEYKITLNMLLEKKGFENVDIRNVYEVLFDFESVDIPFSYFIEAVGF
jgi:hypothetical protein